MVGRCESKKRMRETMENKEHRVFFFFFFFFYSSLSSGHICYSSDLMRRWRLVDENSSFIHVLWFLSPLVRSRSQMAIL